MENVKGIAVDGVWYLVQHSVVDYLDHYVSCGKICQEAAVMSMMPTYADRVIGQSKDILPRVRLFTPPWVEDVHEIAKTVYRTSVLEKSNGNWILSGTTFKEQGFIDGYNLAKEKYKYTEEDIVEIVCNILDGDYIHTLANRVAVNDYVKKDILNCLPAPSTYSCKIEIKDDLITVKDYQKC